MSGDPPLDLGRSDGGRRRRRLRGRRSRRAEGQQRHHDRKNDGSADGGGGNRREALRADGGSGGRRYCRCRTCKRRRSDRLRRMQQALVEGAQGLRHLGAVRRPLRRVLLQQLEQDRVEPAGRLRADLVGERRLVGDDAVAYVARRGGQERVLAGDRLEEDETEREQVGAAVDDAADDLLRRGVAAAADGVPAHVGGGARKRLDAEADELGGAVREDDDARRRDRAVDESGGVRVVQRLRHGRADEGDVGVRDPPPAGRELAEVLAVGRLVGDVGHAARLVVADLEDAEDARVAEPGHAAGARQEALAEARRLLPLLGHGRDLEQHRLAARSAVAAVHQPVGALHEDRVQRESGEAADRIVHRAPPPHSSQSGNARSGLLRALPRPVVNRCLARIW